MSFLSVFTKLLGMSDSLLPSKGVTYKSALGLPPAWYAHSKICGDVGLLPLDVKRIVGDGSQNDTTHFGYRLMRESPNMVQAPSVFKEQVTSHAIMRGNGRVAIVRDGEAVTELIPMLPDRTATVYSLGRKFHITRPEKMDGVDMFEGWETDQHGYLIFDDVDVLHIMGVSYDGIQGIGLLDVASDTFGFGSNTQTYLNNQIRKGFRGKLFLEAPAGALRTEKDAKEFIDKFNEYEGGVDNASKAALLREGVKASAISMSNNDAQLAELAKLNRQDIGMLFGLEGMPGDGESVSYNSLEQKDLAYLKALDRWLIKWEEQCDIKLRTQSEKRLGRVYYKFNRAAIHRTDLQTTMTALCNAITHRIMSPNEARAKLDLNPYEGGDTFENPAITPGQSQQTSDNSSSANAALRETLSSLFQREANNAISGAKNKDFLGWIDRNYAKWELKLADKFESIGLDRDLASSHCSESKEMLLDCAGSSTPENLVDNVKTLVENWKLRAYTILETCNA